MVAATAEPTTANDADASLLADPPFTDDGSGYPFDPAEYVIKSNVALIDEHQPGRDRDGNERPYIGYQELKKVADAGNFRIDDTGDFVPVVVGHTPDGESDKQPPIVGFAGPFRLAKIGNRQPRWAIVAEKFAIRKEHERLASEHPRRSVELWFNKTTGLPEMMDPIALLGATTPERALGLKLSAKHAGSDLICERYEMRNAAAEKTGDAGKQCLPQDAGEHTEIDAITAKVLDVLERTDYVQYVRDLMKRHAAEVAASLEEGSGELGDRNDPIPGQEADQPEEGDMPATAEKNAAANANDQDPAGTAGDDTNKGAASDAKAKDKAEKENYSKAAAERDEYREKYQKEKREREDLATRLEALESEFGKIKAEKVQVERYNKLRDLVDRGYMLDLDEEVKEVADMGDAECERYMKGLERNARRVPIGHTIHDNLEPEKFAKSGDTERDGKRAEVRRLCDDEGMSYEAACKKVGYTPTV